MGRNFAGCTANDAKHANTGTNPGLNSRLPVPVRVFRVVRGSVTGRFIDSMESFFLVAVRGVRNRCASLDPWPVHRPGSDETRQPMPPIRSRAKNSRLRQRPGAPACCVAREKRGAPDGWEGAMRHVEGRRDRRTNDERVTDGEGGDGRLVRSGGYKP